MELRTWGWNAALGLSAWALAACQQPIDEGGLDHAASAAAAPVADPLEAAGAPPACAPEAIEPAPPPREPAIDAPTAAPSAKWCPDGQYIAVARGRAVDVVAVKSGEVRRIGPLAHDVDEFAFSPRGDRLALATHDGGVAVWRVSDLAPIAELRGPGERDPASCLRFTRDGRRLASCDGTVWDVDSGRTAAQVPITGAYELAWSEDGRYLISGGMAAQLWDVASGRELVNDGLSCFGSHPSPDGLWVAAAHSGHELYAGPLGGARFGPMETARGCAEHLFPSFSDDSRTLLVVGGARYRA
jgi:hypothetical protein